jgi:hypothetical protein
VEAGVGEKTYPCVDLALVFADDAVDVGLHHAGELGLVGDGGDPGRQLAVPDSGVTTDQLAVGGGEVDEVVRAGECELALSALGGVPLHADGC